MKLPSHPRPSRWYLCGTLLLALCFAYHCGLPANATAQATDTLRENPDIFLLRHIWRVNGVEEQDGFGQGIGSVGDLDGDGVSEIAHKISAGTRWFIHRGGEPAPQREPFWSFPASRPFYRYPIVGRFLPEKHSVGFAIPRTIFLDGGGFVQVPTLWIFDTLNGTLKDTASFLWDPQFENQSTIGYFPSDYLAPNLDTAAGDEFIVAIKAWRTYTEDSFTTDTNEIWIYRGGENFSLDAPTLRLSLPEKLHSNLELHTLVSDLDGDGYNDLMATGQYTEGTLMKIWFGDSTSPWDWTGTPDRTINVSAVGLGFDITHGDFDGDGLLDFAGTVLRNERFTTNIFLSGTGKSIRDRSFSEADIDRSIFTDVFQVVPGPAPFLNDSTRTYAMLALKGPSRFEKGSDMLYFLSGGRNGPNATADAFWAPSRDGVASGPVLLNFRPIPDCNGDNFDDLMVGDPKWYYNLFSYGIALVLAGTDSIPNDDPTVSVRSGGTGSTPLRLSLYPNPASHQATVSIPLSLVHRGATLVLRNTLGEVIRRIDVPAGSGRITLDVADLADGLYLIDLTGDGAINDIYQTSMIKEASGE